MIDWPDGRRVAQPDRRHDEALKGDRAEPAAQLEARLQESGNAPR
ncbi:hypothetical protein [Roseomonas sp. AR75]|nr:hypothetical protein [Roseomonas sp. AR75]